MAQYADVIVASRDGEDDTAHQVEQILRTVASGCESSTVKN